MGACTTHVHTHKQLLRYYNDMSYDYLILQCLLVLGLCGERKTFNVPILFISIYGGCRKHNFRTARVKLIKNYIFGILTSRAIDWYIYGLNRGGVGWGGPPMWLYYFWGGLQFLLGHFHGFLKISSESLAQAQSIGTLFE
jgi:hypothetical protein